MFDAAKQTGVVNPTRPQPCMRCRVRRAVAAVGAAGLVVTLGGWPAGAWADAGATFTERLVVDAADAHGATTAGQLVAGSTYQITARGTYQPGPGRSADAECATYPPDPTYRRSRLGVLETDGPDDPYDLYVDGRPVDWRPAAADLAGCDTTGHTYHVTYVPGRTGPATFRIAVPDGGATGTLLVEITGPASPPTTTAGPTTTTAVPAPTTTQAPQSSPPPSAPVPHQSARREPAPATATTTVPPGTSDTIPPELLEPPPVVHFPTSTAPVQPAGGYALYPVASPDSGLRQLLPVAAALVLLGALASTAHAAVRRHALAGTVRIAVPARGGGVTAHRAAARPPSGAAPPRQPLSPEALTSRIGAAGTCTCPSCGRSRRRRR